MSRFVGSLVQVAGLSLVAFGAWQMWNPLGWIVAGAAVVTVGIGLERDDA